MAGEPGGRLGSRQLRITLVAGVAILAFGGLLVAALGNWNAPDEAAPGASPSSPLSNRPSAGLSAAPQPTELVDCNQSTFTSDDVPKTIPDLGTVDSTLRVAPGDPVQKVNVRLGISHPFASDLRVDVVSPAGTIVTLADSVGLWGDDFRGTIFDAAARDSGPVDESPRSEQLIRAT